MTASTDEKFQAAFAGEIRIMNARVATLEHVVECKDPDKLKQHLASFNEIVSVGGDDTMEPEAQAAAMGMAPPCEQYMDLQPMKNMDDIFKKYNAVTTQDQLKDITAQLAKLKGAIGNLLSRCLGAEKALTNAGQRLEKSEAKLKAEKEKSNSAPKIVSANVLHDQGATLATQIQTIVFQTASDTSDLSKPLIVQVAPWLTEIHQDNSEINAKVKEFRSSYHPAADGEKGLRASKAVDAEAGQAFYQKVMQHFKKATGLVTSTDVAILRPMLDVSVFGIGETYNRASVEHCGVASMRLTLLGTRSVVIIDAVQLSSYMARKGVQGKITAARMTTFLKAMSVSAITEYTQQCSLCRHDRQRRDALHTVRQCRRRACTNTD